MRNKRYTTTALLAALACTASVNAAIVSGSDGVNMGNTVAGRISNMRDLTPGVVGNWTGLAAWARVVAPVANFTGVGYDAGGAAFNVLYANLIPLKTSSLRTVDAAGNTIFLSDATGNHMDSLYLKDSAGGEKLIEVENGQLVVGGVPATGGSGARQFIQIKGVGKQEVAAQGDNIIFGESQDAISSAGASLFTYTSDSITLQPGRTYKLSFNPNALWTPAQASGVYCSYQFYNVTAGGFIGSQMRNWSGVNECTTGTGTVFITPTVATTIQVRLLDLPTFQATFGYDGYDMSPVLTAETMD